MRKYEFMNQLHYFFRDSDKNDLKGIVEDCEEQFRLGREEGLSEEEVCCKLGSPKNIYRYYIGEPVIPEENPTMPEMPDYSALRDAPPDRPGRAYDWEDQELERRRRRASGNSYDAPRRREDLPPSYAEEQDGDFRWDGGKHGNTAATAAKAVASPLLQILGALCYTASGLLFVALAAAIVASVAVTSMPLYLYTDLLPLPTISTTTLIFANLAILFAALTALYAGQFCSHPRLSSTDTRRRRA